MKVHELIRILQCCGNDADIESTYEDTDGDMCKKNTVDGCSINAPAKCVADNFSHFVRCDYPLFHCDRCKTHSVKFNLNGLMSKNRVPRIVPWCFCCDDYPLVDGNLAIGKEYPELEFKN